MKILVHNRRITFLLLVVMTITKSHAQDCSTKLEEANRAYYNGQFALVSELLEPCLTDLYKEEKTTALRLMVNSNLMINNSINADMYMSKLLFHLPNYQLKKSELSKFEKLYGTYKIETKWRYGITAGINIPDYKILRHQSYASSTQEPTDYRGNTGFIIGVNGARQLWNNVFVTSALNWQTCGYEQQEIILNYQMVRVKEKISYLNMPIQLEYTLLHNKFQPFVSIGFSTNIVLSSKADIDHFGLPSDFPLPYLGVPYSARGYNLSDQRKNMLLNWNCAAGVRRNIGFYQLEFRMTYEKGLQNLVKEERRFSDETLLNDYAYVVDDFLMNNWVFSIGIQKLIQQPIKRK